MQRAYSNERIRHLDKITALAKQHDPSPTFTSFLQQYYHDIAEEDLLQFTPQHLVSAAHSHW